MIIAVADARFKPCEPGLAGYQVGVAVHEAGQDDLPRGVDLDGVMSHGEILDPATLTDGVDATVADQDSPIFNNAEFVKRGTAPRARRPVQSEQLTGPADQNGLRHLTRPQERHAPRVVSISLL